MGSSLYKYSFSRTQNGFQSKKSSCPGSYISLHLQKLARLLVTPTLFSLPTASGEPVGQGELLLGFKSIAHPRLRTLETTGARQVTQAPQG